MAKPPAKRKKWKTDPPGRVVAQVGGGRPDEGTLGKRMLLPANKKKHTPTAGAFKGLWGQRSFAAPFEHFRKNL